MKILQYALKFTLMLGIFILSGLVSPQVEAKQVKQSNPIPCDMVVDLVSGPFYSIQAAIDNSSPGNRICVKPGTYNENLLILQGPLSIIGDGPADSVIINKPTQTSITINTDSVYLENLKIVRDPFATESGINVQSGNSHVFKRLNIVGATTSIFLNNSNNNKIQGCNFEKINISGIKRGIATNNSHGNVILNNVFNVKDAIDLWQSNDNLIKGNQFTGFTEGFNGTYSNNSVVDSNSFNGGPWPVRIDSSLDNIVKNNHIINCQKGVWVNASDNTDIRGNHITDNSHYGIDVSYSNNAVIFNNNILNNGNLQSYNNDGIRIDQHSTVFDLSYNNIHGNGTLTTYGNINNANPNAVVPAPNNYFGTDDPATTTFRVNYMPISPTENVIQVY